LAREILNRYRKAIEEYCSIARNLKEEELALSLAPGKWTIWENLVHIVDVELVGSYRLRKILAEDKPLFLVFDQDAWVDKLDYTGFSAVDLAGVLTGFQAYNAILLSNLHPKQCERVGIHEEKGKITAMDVVTHHINHVIHHLETIRKTLEKASNQAKHAANAK
jgi:hypothetical protein